VAKAYFHNKKVETYSFPNMTHYKFRKSAKTTINEDKTAI
jgi:hypothetical protein